jgi:tRNA pseudouridine32 synthase / 23S rRNA pseudouridine746 synthase
MAEFVEVLGRGLKTLPATVAGVGPSSQWLPEGPWKTILEFLVEYFPISETVWLSRMERGLVVDDTGRALLPDSPYRAGACVFYYREVDAETSIPFAEQVIFEDEHLLVVDKPHFLPTVPAGRYLQETLLVRLRNQGRPATLTPVHRLDRETAGLVLFSLNARTRNRYTALFRERQVHKIYEAIAPAPPTGTIFPLTRRSRIVRGEPFFRMQEVAGEPNAETSIEGETPGPAGLCLFRLRPVTGKKHQLRVHLAAIGSPIVNDRLYPEYVREPDNFSRPLKLLAKSIEFKDPVSGRECYFESRRRL